MTFSHFLILCIIALIGYYVSLLIQPKKKFSYENNEVFKAIEFPIEPPIEVSTEMVSFIPSGLLDDDHKAESITEFKPFSSTIYNTPTISSQCEQSDVELSEYITQEVLQQGSSLFSNILI